MSSLSSLFTSYLFKKPLLFSQRHNKEKFDFSNSTCYVYEGEGNYDQKRAQVVQDFGQMAQRINLNVAIVVGLQKKL